MKWEQQAAAIAAPMAVADTTGKRGVFRIASSTSNTSTALPTPASASDGVTRKTWAGRYVRVQSMGVDTQVAFSTTARALVYNQASAISTGSAVAGWTIPAGTYQDFIVPQDATHINFISSATGGFLELYMADLLVP